jgi:purine catabolism regulator
VVTRASQVVLLIPHDPDAPTPLTVEAVESFAKELLATLRPVLRSASLSAGVGNLTKDSSGFVRAHEQAQQALRLSRRSGARHQVVSYQGLGAFRLLLEVERPEVLRQYVTETLGPLLSYSQDRPTPLLETLEAMVEARWNRRAAARALRVHVNSLLYRLQRIEELSGLKLDHPEVRVNVAVALRARSLLGGGPLSSQ